MLRALTLAIAAWAMTGSANADQFTYYLGGYPAEASLCHSVARELGAKFSRLYNVPVTDATCERSSHPSEDRVTIRVRYSAARELIPVNTTISLAPRIIQGWYNTKEECEAKLEEETTYFTETTSLQPFSSICQFDRFSPIYPWYPRIDSAGNARLTPFYAGNSLFGLPVGFTRASFEQMALDGLRRAGVDVRHTTFVNEGGMQKLTAFYYSDAEHPINFDELANVPGELECQSELNELEKIDTSANVNPIGRFCVKGYAGNFDVVSFSTDEGLNTYRHSLIAESFADYGTCVAQREQMIEYYRTTLGRKALGLLCTRDTETTDPRASWTARLFEEK